MKKLLKKLRRRLWFAGEVLKAFRGNDTAFLLVTYQPETKKLEVIRGNLTERGATDLLTMAAVRELENEDRETHGPGETHGRASQQGLGSKQGRPAKPGAVWAWNISLN